MILMLAIAAILLGGFILGWIGHVALLAYQARKVMRRLEQFKRAVYVANQSLIDAQQAARALSNQWHPRRNGEAN